MLPGMAAAGLGALYATGALVKAGQLRAEDLPLRDTLPLVPLEQILATGIGTVVSSVLIVAIYASASLVYLWIYAADADGHAAKAEERKRVAETPATLATEETPPAQPESEEAARGGFHRLDSARAFGSFFVRWMLLPANTVLAFAVFPVFYAVIITAGAFMPYVAANYARRGRRAVVLLVTVYFVLVLTCLIANTYFFPDPLPEAELRLRNGAVERGTLVVSTGNAWFITMTDRTYRMVPSDRVAAAIVRSRPEREDETPVLQALWDWTWNRQQDERPPNKKPE